jgi:xylulokinase
MSLLGIDVGTTGCKAVVFSEAGQPLASAYEEYDFNRPEPGWAELDASDVWARIKRTIAAAVRGAGRDPVSALAVSSMGEAMVPVTRDRQILGPSLLNFDVRGNGYLKGLAAAIDNETLYRINGNTLGANYGLTKLMSTRDNAPELYAHAWKFLLWSGFVSYMLGAEARVDFSLANRTLLFDLQSASWSPELARIAGLDLSKMPDLVPAGTVIGEVTTSIAAELGLRPGTPIVSGTHDQCANAVGCGVVGAGHGMCGMGTYLCIVPVFAERREPQEMMPLGLNTEHHAAPGRYVTFIYNQGGQLLKWYRDTFARVEKERAVSSGEDIYEILIREAPTAPSSVLVLPSFTMTGPPEFIPDPVGAMVGLRVETTRGDILKGIMEGVVFYQKEMVDGLASTGIEMSELRAGGGGSKSDAWLQICADVLEKPVIRAKVGEAGCLGAAVIAGTGTGKFPSLEQGVEAMVGLGTRFEPDPVATRRYAERYAQYSSLWKLLRPRFGEYGKKPV